jgi:two-component sensor histidine kinase
MILHELGTNAAKHGALSVASGHVSVIWDVRDNIFDLRWTETGGPSVEPPSSQGFGTTLIAHTVERELQGEITFAYASAGLQCRLTIPLDDVPVYRKAA